MRADSSDVPGRVLVAAVGLAWMRDLAFGVRVAERLRARGVPPAVDVEDWSFGTITAFQRLAERPYARAVLVSGTPRGRAPGTLHRDDAPRDPPPLDEVHARVGDSVMGSVSVDNLVAIGRCYGALPEDVVLIEAEPVDDGWGDDLSPEVERLVDEAVAAVLREVHRAPAGPPAAGGAP